MTTHGRGSGYAHGILSWRWVNAGVLIHAALAHRLPVGFTPTWVTMVPPTEEKPDWVDASATAYAADEDTYYVW